MKINQIYALINDINQQMWGSDAVETHDLAGLISLGEQFSGDLVGADKFLGKLVDRIGKTVIRTLDLELDFPSLYMDSFEFGAMLQKITVNPMNAIETSEWKVGDVDFTPTFANVVKHDDVHVTYFTGANTFKFFTTIPDDLFFTAFTSEASMMNFVDAIIGSMTDSITMSVNNWSRTTVNNFIAEKILAGNGVINLLAEYNALLGSGNEITAEVAMHDKEFARFASQVIRNYVKYLGQPSSLYNVGGTNGAPIIRATQRDNMHVMFLTNLKSLFDAYLLSDSYKDLYDIPNFTEVAYWQGNNGDDGINSFATNSTIDVTPSSQESVATVGNRYSITQSGVVAVLADRQAIAIGINKRRAGSFRNDVDGYTNYSNSITQQNICDLSENGIIFLVADEVATPAISLDKSTLTFAGSTANAQTLTATTVPDDATVTWKSSKSSVATVSSGTVTPAGTGECTITAEITVGGTKYTATCGVTVG